MGGPPKIMVPENPPNHPFVHRVFHYKPSILEENPPIFGNIQISFLFGPLGIYRWDSMAVCVCTLSQEPSDLKWHQHRGNFEVGERLPSLKLIFSPLKMMVSNRTLLFQGSVFRGYVSFREGNPRKGKINLEMEERPFLYISYHLFFRASVYFLQGMSWPDLEILIIPKPLRGKISKQLFWLCLCQQSWVIDWSLGRSWIWVVLKASGDKDLEPRTKNGWMDGWGPWGLFDKKSF